MIVCWHFFSFYVSLLTGRYWGDFTYTFVCLIYILIYW